jgi:hypothetical protein
MSTKQPAFRFAVPVLIAVLLLTPILPELALAQEATDACANATAAVSRNISGGIWIAAGFFGCIFGLVLAYAIEPNPPATALVGKSPEYVASYIDCYRSATKSKQTNSAWIGCGGCALACAIYFIGLAAAVDDSSY